ncbi:MAG: hypothetical protein MUE70_02710 [Desulfobacterales bacterium]|jgi:hypothetical protein|nr:hypothetical protein [Desulfobacterales bacterium]
MSHHHDHDHHHHHDHAKNTESPMTVLEKAVKMIEHWIKHNDDHSATYRDWANKLKKENLPEAAALIDEVAQMHDRINDKFQQAGGLIRQKI